MNTILLEGQQLRIGPTMTANAVMKRFPETAPVFGRYGIVPGACACDCLDELAWHRGMDVEALIQELEAALVVGRRPDHRVVSVRGLDLRSADRRIGARVEHSSNDGAGASGGPRRTKRVGTPNALAPLVGDHQALAHGRDEDTRQSGDDPVLHRITTSSSVRLPS